MRFPRPSTGTILGGVALFVALSGTAVAAAPTVVNIADPAAPAHKATVDATGHLKVGDGAGPLTVDGSVGLAAPSAFVHGSVLGMERPGCVLVFAAPTGKALIVRDVRVDVYGDPTPGSGNTISFYTGTGCASIVADVNPPGVGETVLPFDPGLAIPQGQGLYATTGGNVEAETYADGYTVPATQVPASAVRVTGHSAQ